MTAEPLPDWLRPPPGGFTADDLDRLPDLPSHTELIDGSLVFVSPQTKFHALVGYLLEDRLRRFAPPSLRVRREMSVTLDRRQRPEPDIVVVDASGDEGMDRTTYRVEDVVLAVEVVSVESERRDRERKPQLYAAAKIRHFWRVENVNGRPTVYVYELDEMTHSYIPTGIHHDRLKLTVPFDIDIDLTDIDRL
jgi:Uma2 family endonuclease